MSGPGPDFGAGGFDDEVVLFGEGSEGPPVGPATLDPAPNIALVAGTANVVPVEFVGAPGIGIVRARLVSPGPNVVPVREAPGDASRVRICLAP